MPSHFGVTCVWVQDDSAAVDPCNNIFLVSIFKKGTAIRDRAAVTRHMLMKMIYGIRNAEPFFIRDSTGVVHVMDAGDRNWTANYLECVALETLEAQQTVPNPWGLAYE